MSACNSLDTTASHDRVEGLSPMIAALFHGKPDVVFVDPRPPAAIAKTGRIPGALAVSLDDLRAGSLPTALRRRGLHVITSCQAGPMGAAAAEALKGLGFERVHFVEGGTQSWLDAGLPTER